MNRYNEIHRLVDIVEHINNDLHFIEGSGYKQSVKDDRQVALEYKLEEVMNIIKKYNENI